MRRVRLKTAYYSVHALRDGTIWLAMPVRKPTRKTLPVDTDIDEDGICRWFLEGTDRPRLGASGNVVFNTTVATCLNVKRIIRTQVTDRLDQLGAQLDRIEAVLNSRANKSREQDRIV